MFILVLNPMRGRAEEQRMVARAETREELIEFYRRERCEPYSDTEQGGYREGHEWRRFFRAGGPLAWFNKLEDEEGFEPDYFGHGIVPIMTEEEAAEAARAKYRAALEDIPLVSSFPVVIDTPAVEATP